MFNFGNNVDHDTLSNDKVDNFVYRVEFDFVASVYRPLKWLGININIGLLLH